MLAPPFHLAFLEAGVLWLGSIPVAISIISIISISIIIIISIISIIRLTLHFVPPNSSHTALSPHLPPPPFAFPASFRPYCSPSRQVMMSIGMGYIVRNYPGFDPLVRPNQAKSFAQISDDDDVDTCQCYYCLYVIVVVINLWIFPRPSWMGQDLPNGPVWIISFNTILGTAWKNKFGSRFPFFQRGAVAGCSHLGEAGDPSRVHEKNILGDLRWVSHVVLFYPIFNIAMV